MNKNIESEPFNILLSIWLRTSCDQVDMPT